MHRGRETTLTSITSHTTVRANDILYFIWHLRQQLLLSDRSGCSLPNTVPRKAQVALVCYRAGFLALLIWFFCFQGVDFPTIPTESIILVDEGEQNNLSGYPLLGIWGVELSVLNSSQGSILCDVESIVNLPGKLCSSLVCLHNCVCVTRSWPCHGKWNAVGSYGSRLLNVHVYINCVCIQSS